MFGGNSGSYDQPALENDVWALSLDSGNGTWTRLAPSGTPPAPRVAHSAIYDPVRDRMLVFSGQIGTGPDPSVWALSLSGTPAWYELTAMGTPPQVFGQGAVYDPVHDRMLLSGFYGELYELTLTGTPTWSPITPDGGAPRPEYGKSATWDDAANRLVIQAGGYPFVNEVVAMDIPASRHGLVTTSLPAIGGTVLHDPVQNCYDDGSQVTLTATPETGYEFSGWSGDASGTQNPLTITMDGDKNLVANFTSLCGVWSLYNPPGTLPNARDRHNAIYDPVRQRMIVFGGLDYSVGYANDAWALSLTGGPSWTPLEPAGAPPPGRLQAAAVYDPVRDRMIVIGGVGPGNDDLNDVWALTFSGSPTWTQLTPSGTPPTARSGFKAIYDPVRDRIVLFGGDSGTYDQPALENDVWALSLDASAAWSSIATSAPEPSPRSVYAAAYDPVRDRLVIYGGYTGGSPGHVHVG